MQDYKNTLNLPKTDFSMRGNLAQNEPKRYESWGEFYTKMRTRDAKTAFNIHDGPPYANGNLHIGHALNKILKDIITKMHYFKGNKIYLTPGWDCHGLPIEQQVEKELGDKKLDLNTLQIRSLCRKHAKKFVQIQKDQFKSLGILADWDNNYETMNFEFEASIFEVLCEVAKKGLLIERHKPIYWSWAAQSALADAEVEYKQKVSDSIFVRFSLDKNALDLLDLPPSSLVIWTTTPWTLPANVALAIMDGATYVRTQNGLIIAKELHLSLVKKGVVDEALTHEFKASDLHKLKAINPLNGRESLIIYGNHVSLEDGTGIVHTAPGHGEDDYFCALKYDLPVLMPVNDFGLYDESLKTQKLVPKAALDDFIGIHVFKAQAKILELLGENILFHEKITHSYPHCWRTHEPVIYRATTQWFIQMDKPFFENKTLRQVALEALENVKFYPESGRNRLKSMIENRPDWCISRQRNWGVPIAFFRDKKSGQIIFDDAVLNFIKERFKNEGCDIWWSEDIASLLPDSHKALAVNLEKITHILDVWFESGSTWHGVLTNNNVTPYRAGSYPCDLYLEGSDQHRGWFQSSLLLSCAINLHAPFRAILTHGFTVDEHGEKMSKSKGNVISIDEVLKNHGSEILRLWVSMNEYQSDLRISKSIISQVQEQYKKIRNTLRFLSANISDLDALCPLDQLDEIDIWILQRAHTTLSSLHLYFAKYEFVKGLQGLMNFITNDLSGIYLDVCKDSLYCDDFAKTRAKKTAILIIARNIAHALAPILTYTIDEFLEFVPACFGGFKNVLDLRPFNLCQIQENKSCFDELIKVRALFGEKSDLLKKSGIIKSTLELNIYTDLDVSFLDKWLIVSEVFALNELQIDELERFVVDDKTFVITKARRNKCERCWRFLADDNLCARCQKVL
ncbi:MAG: isoleucine--tRNA ligase [Helicobacter sp.]|nr:isoleucine--tRNA ligase [Helicobacter sp.]